MKREVVTNIHFKNWANNFHQFFADFSHEGSKIFKCPKSELFSSKFADQTLVFDFVWSTETRDSRAFDPIKVFCHFYKVRRSDTRVDRWKDGPRFPKDGYLVHVGGPLLFFLLLTSLIACWHIDRLSARPKEREKLDEFFYSRSLHHTKSITKVLKIIWL